MTDSRILAKLAVDYWKLLRAFERSIQRLPREHGDKSLAQLRYSQRRLELSLQEGGLTLVTFDGKHFEPGMPAAALNGDDFVDGDILIVEATVEPAVVGDMTVLLFGKVMLKKAPSGGEEGDVPRA